MRCWFSNVVIPTVTHTHTTPFYKAIVPSVSARSLPRRRRLEEEVTTNHQVGESNRNSISKEISGSDVLWALQRASSRKKMMKNNKKEHERGRDSSSAVSRMEETCVDYTNVRPLCINDHWGPKLDELENRLRELSDTV
uniref:Uncharacterized protein LOC101494887 n=1 Tax=Cicer arietinum TaxID=3827 RepID=A0A1S2XUU5_CICAR|nr:uncharacterized protein LOC101494887 [Cicer arietinum]